MNLVALNTVVTGSKQNESPLLWCTMQAFSVRQPEHVTSIGKFPFISTDWRCSATDMHLHVDGIATTSSLQQAFLIFQWKRLHLFFSDSPDISSTRAPRAGRTAVTLLGPLPLNLRKDGALQFPGLQRICDQNGQNKIPKQLSAGADTISFAGPGNRG